MNGRLPPNAAQIAREAVLDAVTVCRRAARRLDSLGRLAKGDDSPVTVADFASQAVIVHRLRGLGPILGEEQATILRDPGHAALRGAVVEAVRPVWPDASTRAVLDAIDGAGAEPTDDGYWTVDPIDGTRGFVRGGQYAVCLAWIVGGQPQLALLGCPNLPQSIDPSSDSPVVEIDPGGTLMVAEAGQPLRWGPATRPLPPLHTVEPPSTTRPGPVVVTHSVESRHSRLDDMARLLEALPDRVVIRPADSQAKYGMVARGQAHAYLRIPADRQRHELIWDHAPGWLVATTAGMRVTDLRGDALDFRPGARLVNNYGVVCAHPALHGSLLREIERLGLHRREP